MQFRECWYCQPSWPICWQSWNSFYAKLLSLQLFSIPTCPKSKWCRSTRLWWDRACVLAKVTEQEINRQWGAERPAVRTFVKVWLRGRRHRVVINVNRRVLLRCQVRHPELEVDLFSGFTNAACMMFYKTRVSRWHSFFHAVCSHVKPMLPRAAWSKCNDTLPFAG